MLQQEKQAESHGFEWVRQPLSARGEPCETSATCHCAPAHIDALSSRVTREARANERAVLHHHDPDSMKTMPVVPCQIVLERRPNTTAIR